MIIFQTMVVMNFLTMFKMIIVDNIPPKDDENSYIDDDEMMEMLSANIISRSRSRTFCINPRCSSYTKGREKYFTKRISIRNLISSECCQKDCLKHMDFKFHWRKVRYICQ